MPPELSEKFKNVFYFNIIRSPISIEHSIVVNYCKLSNIETYDSRLGNWNNSQFSEG